MSTARRIAVIGVLALAGALVAGPAAGAKDKARTVPKQGTVTVGTVFERSKIPLHKWVLASHLFAAGKKGTSAKQMQRMLGLTYKSAWFMMMRLREASTDPTASPIGVVAGPTTTSASPAAIRSRLACPCAA